MKTSIHLLHLSIGLIATFCIASSCRNETTDTDTVTDSITAESTEMSVDLPAPNPSLPYAAVFNEETDQLDAQANPDFDRSRLNIDTLTHLLRTSYPQIDLKVDRVSNDTIHIQIADATYLTQQMGSSGAHMYLLEVTYAYTELADIQIVQFDFMEGDHAIPGAYTRKRFEEEKPVR